MASKRRDLDRFGSELDVGQAETPADDPAVAEQFLDLVRVRRRSDVEVFGPATQQQIANAAANEVRDVVMLVKPVKNLERVGVDVAARDLVFGSGHNGRLRHRTEIITSAPKEERVTD